MFYPLPWLSLKIFRKISPKFPDPPIYYTPPPTITGRRVTLYVFDRVIFLFMEDLGCYVFDRVYKQVVAKICDQGPTKNVYV